VVWYSGQFYALFFMQNVVKVDSFTANVFVAWSLILGTWWLPVLRLAVGQDRPQADHPGRLPDCCGDHLLPGLQGADQTANPMLAMLRRRPKVTVTADPADCSFQFNPTGTAKFTNSCDIAKALLSKAR
jgi:hypothetical protein